MVFWLKKENKKLDKLVAEAQLAGVGSESSADLVEMSATGHAPERFRYMI